MLRRKVLSVMEKWARNGWVVYQAKIPKAKDLNSIKQAQQSHNKDKRKSSVSKYQNKSISTPATYSN